MKHFIDKISSIGTHSVSAGVIVNSKGEAVGCVAIRFTKSSIGRNKEAGISLKQGVMKGVSYKTTVKTNTHGEPLQELLKNYGMVAMRGGLTYKNTVMDHNVDGILINNEQFKILWAV